MQYPVIGEFGCFWEGEKRKSLSKTAEDFAVKVLREMRKAIRDATVSRCRLATDNVFSKRSLVLHLQFIMSSCWNNQSMLEVMF